MRAGFFQWTTPDLRVELDKAGVLENVSELKATVTQGAVQLVYRLADVTLEEDALVIHFSQEDTGRLKHGKARLQVNVKYSDGKRDATSEGTLYIFDNDSKEAM